MLKWISTFLSSSFPTWLKKPGENFKYLKNKSSFYNEKKAFFIIYKELPLKHLKPNFFQAETPTSIRKLCKENLAYEVSVKFSWDGRWLPKTLALKVVVPWLSCCSVLMVVAIRLGLKMKKKVIW